MAEKVLLTGRCKRNRHPLFLVLETPGGLVVDAPLFAAGRARETWVRRRQALVIGMASRYGCPCRRTALIGDDEMWERIRRGDTQWPVDTYSIYPG